MAELEHIINEYNKCKCYDPKKVDWSGSNYTKYGFCRTCKAMVGFRSL